MSCTWLLPLCSLQKEGIRWRNWLHSSTSSWASSLLLTDICYSRSSGLNLSTDWVLEQDTTILERPNKGLLPDKSRKVGLASLTEKEASYPSGKALPQKATRDNLQQCGLLWAKPSWFNALHVEVHVHFQCHEECTHDTGVHSGFNTTLNAQIHSTSIYLRQVHINTNVATGEEYDNILDQYELNWEKELFSQTRKQMHWLQKLINNIHKQNTKEVNEHL